MNYDTALLYAQNSLHLSCCILQDCKIITENLENNFAGIILHTFLDTKLFRPGITAVYLPDHHLKYLEICCLKDQTTFVFGPYVSSGVPVSERSSYPEKYHIRLSQQQRFLNYVDALPVFSIEESLQNIALLYELLNNTVIDTSQIQRINQNNTQMTDTLKKIHTEASSLPGYSENTFHETYLAEQLFLSLIREGQPERLLSEMQNHSIPFHLGLSSSRLTNYRNLAAMSLALASDAAIKGGLDCAIACHLSDIYLLHVESLEDEDAILSLLAAAFQDYAARVRDVSLPDDLPPVLKNVITYIQRNIHDHLTVQMLADVHQINVTYLSKLFSAKMGVSPGTYIIQEKTREAKRLLCYTDESLAEIACQLSYSSQNHFQQAFKAQTGMTPNQYRKKNSLT